MPPPVLNPPKPVSAPPARSTWVDISEKLLALSSGASRVSGVTAAHGFRLSLCSAEEGDG